MSADPLDPAEVRAAGAAWSWAPVDAAVVVTDEYRLVHDLPDQSTVQWSTTRRPVAGLAAEVERLAREAGAPRLRWWVKDRTAPEDTGEQLGPLGYERGQRLLVMALPVTTDLDVPPEVEVVPATDRETLRQAAQLSADVFGISAESGAQLDHELQLAGLPLGGGGARRYLATIDGRPVGASGCVVEGAVLRLWDGVVVPEARGRGVYRAMVARRLRDARGTSARFGLVKAVEDTSAPILRRLGFATYGVEQCYVKPLSGPQ